MKNTNTTATTTTTTPVYGLVIGNTFIPVTEEQMRSIMAVIAPGAKAQAKPTQEAKEIASKAPKAPEPAPVKAAEKATAPKGAKAQAPAAKAAATTYKHGEIKVTASGKTVSFTYGDTGSRVNDSRIYGKFRELGGTWDKTNRVYTFASAKKAAEVASQMDHFKVIQ